MRFCDLGDDGQDVSARETADWRQAARAYARPPVIESSEPYEIAAGHWRMVCGRHAKLAPSFLDRFAAHAGLS